MRRVLSIPAAAFIGLGGLIHYQLYTDGYRFIDSIGTLFVANAVASVLMIVVLLARPSTPVAAAAVLFQLGSLAALLASRTVGFLGFEEGWTDEAWQILAAEVGAIVALGMVIASRRAAARGASFLRWSLAPAGA